MLPGLMKMHSSAGGKPVEVLVLTGGSASNEICNGTADGDLCYIVGWDSREEGIDKWVVGVVVVAGAKIDIL
jgi:hypothetical protein